MKSTPHAAKRSTRKPTVSLAAPLTTALEPAAPRCELCGEPAGKDGALCPACAESGYEPVAPERAVDDPVLESGVLDAAESAAQADTHDDDLTKSEVVAVVRAHAVKHYDDGWDVVVESWTDAEILDVIQYASFARGAVNLVGARVKLSNAIRADVRAQEVGAARGSSRSSLSAQKAQAS